MAAIQRILQIYTHLLRGDLGVQSWEKSCDWVCLQDCEFLRPYPTRGTTALPTSSPDFPLHWNCSIVKVPPAVAKKNSLQIPLHTKGYTLEITFHTKSYTLKSSLLLKKVVQLRFTTPSESSTLKTPSAYKSICSQILSARIQKVERGLPSHKSSSPE